MRISDWSSDVCSSDLLGILHLALGIALIDALPFSLTVRLLAQRLGRDPHRKPFLEFDCQLIAVSAMLDLFAVHGPLKDLWRQIHDAAQLDREPDRSEEHTSELQSLMRISYAVFCLKKKKRENRNN